MLAPLPVTISFVAEIDLHGDFAQSIFALGNRAQGVVHQAAPRFGRAVDGLQGGIDWTIANAGVLKSFGRSFCRRVRKRTVAVGTV